MTGGRLVLLFSGVESWSSILSVAVALLPFAPSFRPQPISPLIHQSRSGRILWTQRRVGARESNQEDRESNEGVREVKGRG